MRKVGDILNGRPERVWSVSSDQSVLDAVKEMANYEIGALLVIDNDQLVGILSERDYARKVILEDKSSAETPVSHIMTPNPTTVGRQDSVENCMSLMSENDFRHLPVVEEGRVIGMVSIGDLIKSVIEEQKYTINQLEQYIAG